MPGDTRDCTSCGGAGLPTPNLNIRCDNPCGSGPGNTAACESLPSQISNFTQQFFGDVVKTEVNGVVSWSLPCSLDIGLPANPRGVGEGLACYFLRLFNDGIVGLTGPKGDPGLAGTNGNNAFSVTLQGFTQPTLATPYLQILTAYNPALLNNIYVFIDGSGWYLVSGSDGNGTLFLILVQPLSGVSGYIQAGKLVVPSGAPGPSVVGPQGVPGIQGPQGSPGPAYTTDNNTLTFVGSDFSIPLTATAVNFVNSAPEFLAASAGRYLVTVTATVAGASGILLTDSVTLKLKTLLGDVAGSIQQITNLVNGQEAQIVVNALVATTAPGQQISLYASCSTANHAVVKYSLTSLTYMRVA